MSSHDALGDRHELLAHVASLYYEKLMGQQQIAEIIKSSRSTVSRLLTEAHATGIVTIRIDKPLPVNTELGNAAVARYGLQHALVLANSPLDKVANTLERVGGLAARYLDRSLQQNSTLAISWGTSLKAVANSMQEDQRRRVQIVQMLGAVGAKQPDIDGPELARNISARVGGTYLSLNAPLVLDDATVAQALLRQESVAAVLREAASAQMALIGLGGMSHRISSLIRSGFVTRQELDAASAAGVVGDAGGHMLDIHGAVVDTDISRRMVRLDEERLRAIPIVVAVAVGPEKVSVIHAALESGIVNVIVTDSETMAAVLALADETRRTPSE